MKKLIFALLTVLLMLTMILPCIGIAEVVETDVPAPVAGNIPTTEPTIPTEPFTWEYLASIAGATVFTLLVAQFLKFPMDRVWKIPTRVLVYVIALITMLVATAFTGGLTAQTALLAAVNAFIVSMSAMGLYEITFAKRNK